MKKNEVFRKETGRELAHFSSLGLTFRYFDTFYRTIGKMLLDLIPIEYNFMGTSYMSRAKNKLNSGKEKIVKKLRVFKKGIGEDKLLKDLEAVGIKKGDTLMVHSSLSRIGNVKGGATTVIQALLTQIGSEGNLIMPAYSYINSMEHTSQLDNYVFDPHTNVSVTGKITEEFRKRKDVIRSIHPTHSFAAYGPQASFITEGHFKAVSNFGSGTPFHKVRELKGKLVGIGIGIGQTTFYHSVEDFFPARFGKVYLPEPKPIKILVDGTITTKKIYIHDPAFHAIRIDKNKVIENWFRNHFLETGILHEGNFGDTNVWWIFVEDLFNEILALTEKGITIYSVPGL
jgi:aminoglycoside 3-N-acetyltransferase